MSEFQFGLPNLPAAADIDQDTLVKRENDEWVTVSGPQDIDDSDAVGVADVSVSQGDNLSPKRGQLVDYVTASEAITAGDRLEPAANGEVAVFDDTTTGNVCIGRAALDAEPDELVALEFATLYKIAS